MSLQTPEEILEAVRGARAHLMRELEKATSGPRGGRLPRGVRAPRTREEGLAWVQGRVDADFTLPPLDYYFAALRRLDLKNVPPGNGEPENVLESLEAIDAIIACCEQAIPQTASAASDPEPTPPDLTAGEENILATLRASAEPLYAREIASKAGLDVETVKQYLRHKRPLRDSGLIVKTRRGYAAKV
jgi:DNA-binding CsgD family transcriptional regulator